MPSRTELIPAGTLDAIYEYPIEPGVLTNVTLSTAMAGSQFGDAFVSMYITDETLSTYIAHWALEEGYLFRYHPLHWQGMISIETRAILIIRFNGTLPGNMTTFWDMLKSSYIKEIGEYSRAVNK